MNFLSKQLNLVLSYLFLFSILFMGFSCKETKNEKKVLTKEITFTHEGNLKLKKAVTDSVLATLEIEIADDDYQTQTGLMYRKSMKKNRGMLFIFEEEKPHSFYMKNTEIPLDIIFINSQKKVVSIQKNAKPFDKTSLPSKGPAQYVLEVNAGLCDQWNLMTGDVMEFSKL
ncbi:MAG: DUF192 domain-containing protein [Flavobacteriales bacterium]